MKKTHIKLLLNIFPLIFVCLFLFLNTGCGLETYVVIDAPINVSHKPVYTYEFDESYFQFTTREPSSEDAYPGYTFLGTDVYYKIYSSYSTMTSECSALESIASSSTSSSNAPDKLIYSYSFKKLKLSNYYGNVLIPPSENYLPQEVEIRLSNYQNSNAYAARIKIDGSTVGVPLRNNDSELSFDFGRTEDNPKLNKVPVNGDEDVKYTSVSNNGEWYVAMFAIASARDATYTTYYSNILYLGSVTIDANSKDN